MSKKRKRKRLPGHYCKVCGKRKANERFSGKGHAKHICKDCEKLPVERQRELTIINNIMDLPFNLSRDKRRWLDELRLDERRSVRDAARWAYALRYPPRTEMERLEEAWLDEIDWPDDTEQEYLDDFDDEPPF